MQNQTKYLIGGAVALVFIIAGVAYASKDKIIQKAFEPNDTSLPSSDNQNNNTNTSNLPDEEVIAENLSIPWEIAFLPDGDILVTERPGNLKRIGKNGALIHVSGVAHSGEGGLLGMALHPDFKNNNYIYLYSTTRTNNDLANRVERYKFSNDQLTDRKIIIDGIEGSNNHDGGRIAFGPDKLLYITTGDAENKDSAQNKDSLNGKILRVTDEGGIPTDNPYGNAVYSYGHRNPQGITWDSAGNLWETEHGPSGVGTGYDELNKIEKGKNYGWPTIQGDETQAGMERPVFQSGRNETWAPSGIAYLRNHLIYAGLRGQSLYIAELNGGTAKNLTTMLRSKYGRLRTVVVGPDNMLYITTNNGDGRGTKRPGDDKIIRIKPNF